MYYSIWCGMSVCAFWGGEGGNIKKCRTIHARAALRQCKVTGKRLVLPKSDATDV